MTELKKGDPAPDFEAEDGDGKVWRLRDLRGQKVVLYFYPADDTPGCTAEACDFRDNHARFIGAGYVVLGVSPQDADSHRAFSEKHSLPFPLLIDADHEIAGRYGAWGERKMYGNTFEGIIRSTFVIDEGGHIDQALYNVRAKGHVERLVNDLALSR
ncbi:MAG TPA: thioredoxin-dependent thiol peroxidase [Actinomycetota bacterium]|jgi:thioredoxin-dependent peroxiredoxin|nr:thioredoxin-dependent thiol peroxidase [Actinomycetota bacterium]